jgi:hypothetical protein
LRLHVFDADREILDGKEGSNVQLVATHIVAVETNEVEDPERHLAFR